MNSLKTVAPEVRAHPMTRAMAEDHGELLELTSRLAAAPDRGALTEALESLSHELREHFAHEEHAQGVYEILAGSPAHREEVACFVPEHRELLRDLGELVWRAQERSAPSRELESEAAELTARLHDHEARQMRLVQAVA